MNKLMAGSFICVLVFGSISFAQTREQKLKMIKPKMKLVVLALQQLHQGC